MYPPETLLGAEELLYNRRSPEDLLDLAYALAPASEPSDLTHWRATLWSGQMAVLLDPEFIHQDTANPEGGSAFLARILPRLIRIIEENRLTPLERVEAGRILGL